MDLQCYQPDRLRVQVNQLCNIHSFRLFQLRCRFFQLTVPAPQTHKFLPLSPHHFTLSLFYFKCKTPYFSTGRGGNAWLSPIGCAMFSMQIHVPMNSILAQGLPLIQHLVSVAIVSGIRSQPGYEVSSTTHHSVAAENIVLISFYRISNQD